MYQEPGDTGPAGGHRGEYGLEIYQELEIHYHADSQGVNSYSLKRNLWRLHSPIIGKYFDMCAVSCTNDLNLLWNLHVRMNY